MIDYVEIVSLNIERGVNMDVHIHMDMRVPVKKGRLMNIEIAITINESRHEHRYKNRYKH